ncbi:hypothetical protein F5148DRAFT_18949 [Russula earlei]|uniref:Uncharacterized protein n=1 Tax=Russula earlei TaxID=71964 RepID=A0ACC0UL05_9AGAM|nr:hypothetical protein F5148DRAFT_18949 [Russula earlei]
MESTAQPSSRSVPPVTLQSTHIPHRRSPKVRNKRSSPRSSPAKLRDSPPLSPASIERAQCASRSPSPQVQLQQSVGTVRLAISMPNLATDSPRHALGGIDGTFSPPSVPPFTPVSGPSQSVSLALSVAPPFRPSLPGAFLSPSLETPAPKLPPYVPQLPQTEPRAEAVHNPYYRSMAPPPSPNLPPVPTPWPQPPDSGSSVDFQPSSTASSTASTSTLRAPREVVDAAIEVAEKKLAGRVVRKVFSRKGAREHIFQSAVSLHLLPCYTHLHCVSPA